MLRVKNTQYNRPYAWRKIIGKYPPITLIASFWFHFKSGNSPLENQYFSMFQIPLEPLENEASGIFGVFPRIFSSCIGPMYVNIVNNSIFKQHWIIYSLFLNLSCKNSHDFFPFCKSIMMRFSPVKCFDVLAFEVTKNQWICIIISHW